MRIPFFLTLYGTHRLVRFVCVFALLSLTVMPLAAKPLTTPVGNYQLQCDQTFSCPDSLLPRVSFWVEVFSRWNTNTAIFHDKDNPQRVYSTLARKDGCRKSKKGDSIYRERKRLKRELQNTARKIRSGRSLSQRQQHLRLLHAGLPVSEIEKSAERIRCQSGNRDRMQGALQQYHLYRPIILDALEKENLTLELQYLPFVESAFNPEALSHVGAAGLWQIMPETGRSLGLTINHAVDERYDPDPASYAAAKYFRNSVDKLSEVAFENGYSVTARDLNPFVITSYNYGVRGMQRAIKQVGLNYERLLLEYRSPNFQTAVKNFYASFLAARHVAKNVDIFFPGLVLNSTGHRYAHSEVMLPRATSIKRLSQELDIGKDELDKRNPALKNIVFRNKALVPQGFVLRLPYRDEGWVNQIAALNKLPAEYEKPGFIWHKVRSGQTACGIAEKYRASCRALKKLNRLNKRGTIYAGKRLKVPTSSARIGVRNSAASSQRWTVASSKSTSRYIVRQGDSSCQIANRNNMKCGEFLALNGLRRDSILRIGQPVIIANKMAWHIVKKGQTACRIARQYGVACSALLNVNRLRRSATIFVGQRLRIPTRG